MASVRWSSGALDDLDAIGEYYERTSRQYARSLIARLYAAPDALSAHPRLGRVVPEVAVEHIRELIRDGYRIVYLVSDSEVEILAVLHGRQDLGRKLRRE
ncbi:MAG: type II toxin-antitoxin system RelE/ParE family toxin [Bacteroidota bacterium]